METDSRKQPVIRLAKLSATHYDLLKKAADRQGMTVNTYARDIIITHIIKEILPKTIQF